MQETYPMLDGIQLPNDSEYFDVDMEDNTPFKDTMNILTRINRGRNSAFYLLKSNTTGKIYFTTDTEVHWYVRNKNITYSDLEGKIVAIWQVVNRGGTYILSIVKPPKEKCPICKQTLKNYTIRDVNPEEYPIYAVKGYFNDKYYIRAYGCEHCGTVERDD